MHNRVWWKQLHWPEYGAELLGTAFLVFAGVSAVVFVFGTGTPLAQILPDTSTRRLIAGLLFAGCGALAVSTVSKCVEHTWTSRSRRPESVRHSQRSCHIPRWYRLRCIPKEHVGWDVPRWDQR